MKFYIHYLHHTMISIPPKGTAHRRRNLNLHSPAQPQNVPERHACTTEELQGLDEKIKNQFGWINGPRTFQMKGINAQLQLRDVLIHAGTGLGKTGVAAGPHVHPSAKGKVTIMVSPLIALHDEMASGDNTIRRKKTHLKCTHRSTPSAMSSN
jgi:superfamily II DNA helicase RecQ